MRNTNVDYLFNKIIEEKAEVREALRDLKTAVSIKPHNRMIKVLDEIGDLHFFVAKLEDLIKQPEFNEIPSVVKSCKSFVTKHIRYINRITSKVAKMVGMPDIDILYFIAALSRVKSSVSQAMREKGDGIWNK